MASVKRNQSSKATGQSALSHRIHALLHTVRVIGHAEDELCTLLHEAEHGEAAGPAFTRELKALLGRLPAVEYLHDLEALEAVVMPVKVPGRKQGKHAVVRPKAARAKEPVARKVGGKKVVSRRVTVAKKVVKRRAKS